MVGAAQQVEQGLVVILACSLQGCKAPVQLCLKTLRVKAFFKHGVTRQLVYHAGVFEQVARRPACRAQHV